MSGTSGKELRLKRLQSISRLEEALSDNTDLQKMLELGALYYADNRVQDALDLFYKVVAEDEKNVEARCYIQQIRGVLDFVNVDLMNP